MSLNPLDSEEVIPGATMLLFGIGLVAVCLNPLDSEEVIPGIVQCAPARLIVYRCLNPLDSEEVIPGIEAAITQALGLPFKSQSSR